jgi:chitinase
MIKKIDSSGNVKKLSPWRLLIALTVIVLFSSLIFSSQKQWRATQAAQSIEPWFASYVDVTATPTFAFEQMGTTVSTRNAVLSFIVASPKDACTPSWGDSYTLDDAAAYLDLDRRIARLQQQGGSIAVSFGGLLNDELAVVCEDKDKLTSAYEEVINRYDVDTIDLDLEGDGLTNLDAGKRRAESLAKLQSKQRDDNKSLAIWLTLPVTAQGLNEDGTNAISLLLENGVDIAGVNIMTMNFGESKNDMDMYDASVNSLN